MTTFEPGAKLVFTHGLLRSPFSTAFLATRPAPIITDGLDVLVQLVIAAIATAPCESSMAWFWILTSALACAAMGAVPALDFFSRKVFSEFCQAVLACFREILSCGLVGPASE